MKKIAYMLASALLPILVACTSQTPSVHSDSKIFQTEGTLVIAHEVRSFKPVGSSSEFWVVDKTGELYDHYDAITHGIKNGTPVQVKMKVTDCGPSKEGFARGYASVYEVVDILSMQSKQR